MLLNSSSYNSEMVHKMQFDSITLDEITVNLETYLEKYENCFANKSQKMYFSTFIKGLLSDLDRKSIEPIALSFLSANEVRGLQQFFKRSTYDDKALRSAYQTILADSISDSMGMLCVDGSDFAKKGSNSAGVFRQHCGRLGKTENCQAGVFVSYVSHLGYGLLDSRLYLPNAWFTDDYKSIIHLYHQHDQTYTFH